VTFFEVVDILQTSVPRCQSVARAIGFLWDDFEFCRAGRVPVWAEESLGKVAGCLNVSWRAAGPEAGGLLSLYEVAVSLTEFSTSVSGLLGASVRTCVRQVLEVRILWIGEVIPVVDKGE
jgi:hypothetical protein